jgi:hypothetical protein
LWVRMPSRTRYFVVCEFVPSSWLMFCGDWVIGAYF